MSKKLYSLLSTEPLNEFESSCVRAMQQLADLGIQPQSSVIIVLEEDGTAGTFYHNASLQDMMVMKGFLDLDIQADARAAEEWTWEDEDEGEE